MATKTTTPDKHSEFPTNLVPPALPSCQNFLRTSDGFCSCAPTSAWLRQAASPYIVTFLCTHGRLSKWQLMARLLIPDFCAWASVLEQNSPSAFGREISSTHLAMEPPAAPLLSSASLVPLYLGLPMRAWSRQQDNRENKAPHSPLRQLEGAPPHPTSC